jgi:hypothetical protein
MALLAMNGFDELASNIASDLSAAGATMGWSTLGNSSKIAGQLGGFAVNFQGSGLIRWNAGAVKTTSFFVGARFQPNSAILATPIIEIMDGALGIQCGISTNSSGILFAWRGTTANVLATGSTVLVLGSWYYVEFGGLIGTSTAGNVTIKLNGNAEATNGACNTQATANANWQTVQLANTTTQIYLDDLYICDSSGSSPQNTFLAPSGTGMRIETLFPTSDNSVSFAPLANANWQEVSEAACDNDTSYNAAAAAAVDSFNHGALSSTPVSIFGVMVETRMRTDNVGTATGRTKLISGATTQNGASHTVSSTYQMYGDIYINDPDTATAWTATGVNATKIGYERVF